MCGWSRSRSRFRGGSGSSQPEGKALARLSICIPTYNRARILDDTLGRLPLFDCEIVVSDNASPDDTSEVVTKHMRYDRRIRYVGLPENRGVHANERHAVEAATGELVCYLADDDSLLSEPLLAVCGLFERDPELVACYCDHICWDDARGVELHRYGFPAQPHEYRNDGFALVEFLLRQRLAPEIGVYRRNAWLAAHVPCSRAMPFHIWCYAFHRLGKARFDPTCFYREHWILKPGLARTYWNNQTAFNYIGDEQRLGLEAVIRLAELDAGGPRGSSSLTNLLDQMLLERTSIEIQRAFQRGDDVLCVELRRRQRLWGSPENSSDALLATRAAEKTGFDEEMFRV